MLSPSVRGFGLALSLLASACTLNDPSTLIATNGPADAATAPDAATGSVSDIDSGPPEPGTDAGPSTPRPPPPRSCEAGETLPCGPATENGICNLGVRYCDDGAWGACMGAVYPEPRDCGSDEDNDCDGQPDNLAVGACTCVAGSIEPCGTHPGLDGSGPCKAGVRECIASEDGQSSAWGPCVGSVGPKDADSCSVSGDDGNCNGTPNDGCPCVEGEVRRCGPNTDRGICAYGTTTCRDGQLTACSGAVFPRTRDCSSELDNDCDGFADDTPDAFCTCDVGTAAICNPHPGLDGFGPCRAGTRRCDFGSTTATSTLGACEGSVGPGLRNCASTADNDCDGAADNTIDADCTCTVGSEQVCGTPPAGQSSPPCRAGVRTCLAGAGNLTSAFGACVGAVAPAPRDSCSIVNDDATCDGVRNGGCECVTGRGNADCSTKPAASVCNSDGVCVACRAAADCALVPGRNVCAAGVCVQCAPGATQACAAGQVCENQVCVTPPEPVATCGACTSDAQCGASARCVAQAMGGGSFCFPLSAAGACATAPFSAVVSATSASGAVVSVCQPRATTCQALADFDRTACPVVAGVGDGTACGLASVNDGVCVPDPAPSSAGRCSVPCVTAAADCPRGECVQGACAVTPPAAP